MKLLSRFERSIERLMEGSTGSLFRQTLQPAEIGRKLERVMLSQKRASVGSALVPNLYVVRLNPKDYAHFAAYSHGLARQMEAWLAQVATQRNLSVIDRINVTLVEDESAPRRSPAIDAVISDGQRGPRPRRSDPPPPSQATAAFDVMTSPPVPSARLRMVDGAYRGQEFDLLEGTTTIGRSPDNAIALDAPDVSRRHARFENSSGRLRIFDLNSTNGTRVNGEHVRICDIEDGDEILIGSQRMNVTIPGFERFGRRGGR